ncbi:MAG: gamma-glutamyltransferase [Alphaproteobacteria bacterium]|nr:gamma-glutamyltransferase [Alphaproteobacteria bacterium]
MPDFRAAPFLALPFAALLAGCSIGSSVGSALGLADDSEAQLSQSTGLAVGDEPFSVRSGTAILAQGGSAADAVTAMFFAMSATYPVAAGLGGGGICLVADPVKGVREFDFLPRAAKGGGGFAVPGAVRGFYDLQTAFGILPWQRTVSGGEAYAASGFPISHALSTRLANAQNSVRLDAGLAAEFMNENGTPRPEGAIATNRALSQTLATIRLSGADGFYKGAVADALVRYSASQGGAITAADLADYRTTVTSPRMMTQGGLSVAMPNAETGAGAFATSLFANAASGSNPEGAVVAAVRQSLSSFGISALPSDLGGTGFAAIDRNGQVATCAMTMNGAFGAARNAADTGVLLANAPSAPGGVAGAFLTPLIARDGAGRVALAGVGAGGPNGTAAIAYALLKVASGQQMGRPADLRSTGAAPMVTVNVISCQNGCVALPDPGGHGLGDATTE